MSNSVLIIVLLEEESRINYLNLGDFPNASSYRLSKLLSRSRRFFLNHLTAGPQIEEPYSSAIKGSSQTID